MVNLLPAVLIGGPPHAGKSILTYNLTQALRKRHIEHYVLRACPDGEGDWSQETQQETVRLIRIKGKWTDTFVKLVCRDLERRPLPLLVDIGGLPTEDQIGILRRCTHSILLLHRNNPETATFWRHLIEVSGLLPLASIYSERSGDSAITADRPVIEGTLVGLNPGKRAHGPLFELLVDRLASLFAYLPDELEKTHLDAAPVELVANLNTIIQAWAPETRRWAPAMIPSLLAELPANTPLAVYGRGPNWLYGSLATQSGNELFYQFDSRLGWITPPRLQIAPPGTELSPELHVTVDEHKDATVLKINIVIKYLDYTEAENLSFPAVPTERGLILSGAIPYWLLTALVRLYNGYEQAWIACHHPPLNGAIVAFSRTPDLSPGDFVSMPAG
ncbi:MAG TPA: CRISPR-associated protein Csx3 [Ktedonobacteraceae bacterium]|jgi:CRISPR-associated protein Csx3|nr:CRISPR-associated protein Csx3 [Ktedonobacteraceae bacterium]